MDGSSNMDKSNPDEDMHIMRGDNNVSVVFSGSPYLDKNVLQFQEYESQNESGYFRESQQELPSTIMKEPRS